MSFPCAIANIVSMPPLKMEVDQHATVDKRISSLKSQPTVISVINSIESIGFKETESTDTPESRITITLEEPTVENLAYICNASPDFGCGDQILQNSSKSNDEQASIIPILNEDKERSKVLAQKCKTSIAAPNLSGSESESDTESNCSRSTLNSTTSCTFHACTVPGCNKKFSRPSRLQQHSRIHTGERPYVCPVADCGRSYTRSQHLLRHTQITHKAEECQQKPSGDNKCSKCGKQFASVYSLRKHVSQFHERRKYSCNECSQVFLKQQHLRTHSQTHSKEPVFKCDFPGCTASFFLPSKLQRHKQQHVPGRYKCSRDPTCEQTFDRHVDLRRHLASQHPFICSICGVEFAEQSRYNRHRTTHEDLRLTYHCTKPGCGRCYYTLRALTSHVRNSHDQQAPQHECVVCTKRFATKQKLQQHLKTHGPDCGRIVKNTPKKTRKTRRDKGIGRTDYRSLLAGFHSVEPLRNSKDLKEMELVEEPNELIDRPSLVNEKLMGTRRLLEGSVVARHELTANGIISSSDNHNDNVQNMNNANQTCEPTASKTPIDPVPSIDEPQDLPNQSIAHNTTEPKDCNSEHFESNQIGSIYISGHGAVKQSHVLLSRMNDRMVKMLQGCKLAGSGK